MKKLFGYEGPVMQFLIKTTDLFLLTLITWLCCIPIVTCGAAYSAKYYVVMKIIRDEDTYILRDYIKAFKNNFKQSTKIWLVNLVLILFLAWDWSYVLGIGLEHISINLIIALGIVSVIILMFNSIVYGMVARFDMKTKNLIRMSIMVEFARIHFWLASGFCVIYLLVLTYNHMNLFPIWLFCGSALSAFIHGFLLVRTFRYLETPTEESTDLSLDITSDNEEDQEI